MTSSSPSQFQPERRAGSTRRATGATEEQLKSLGPILDSSALLTDRVEQTIREAIFSGVLKPGSHLSVPAIAGRLNTSRTPVRDALFRLERDGLAEVTPHRGAIVLDGSRHDLEQLFELREPLEGMAAQLAAQRMTPTQHDELAALVERQRGAVTAGDLEAHVATDMAFHALIRDGAGNTRLTDALARIESQIRLVMRAGASRPGGMPAAAVTDHEIIRRAIAAGDGACAEKAARAHVRAVGELLAHLLFP